MKKKALFITGNLLPCFSGDAIYSYGIIERIKSYYVLDVITYVNKVQRNDENYVKLKKSINKLITIDYYTNIVQKIFRYIKYRNSVAIRTTEMIKEVNTILETNEYDVIFIDHLRMYFVYDILKKKINREKTKLVLIQHNYENMNIDQELETFQSIYDRFKFKLKNIGLKNYEVRAIKSVDFIFSISETDKEHFRKIIQRDDNIYVINPYFQYKRIKSEEDILKSNYNLLILGSMSWYPNVEGCKWFIENVFKKIIVKDKRYKLYIVGNNPHQDILKYESNNIIVTGRVPSVDEYIKISDFLIVPNRLGGGVKIKILEGIMKGIPILAVKESITGYPSDIFKNGFCVNEPNEFIESIFELSRDSQKKIEFIRNGKKIINSFKNIEYTIKDLM